MQNPSWMVSARLFPRSGRSTSCFCAEHEIDGVRGNAAQLSFIAESAFEHRQAAGHRGDVERGGLRISRELAARHPLRQGVRDQAGDARDQTREGLARIVIESLAFDRS